MKQDSNLVRTAADLERKYDFNSIGELKRNFETQNQNLIKVENELNNFAKATIKDLENLQNQVDGNITTWFFNDIPTLDNEPANEWKNDEDKNNHLGDLYYDQNTGYAYRFSLIDNVYSWVQLKDSDIAEALALANSAKDTADTKRRVFINQPIPPYDVGDLWINNEELYRCQVSVVSGLFSEADWIKAVKYTDDTVANRVDDDLKVLSGSVLEIKKNVDEYSTTIKQTTQIVNNLSNEVEDTNHRLMNEYITSEDADKKIEETRNYFISEMQTTISQTKSDWEAEVLQKVKENGIETLKNLLVTININGIEVATNLSKISTLITNDTFAIKDNAGNYLAYFGYDENEKRSKAEMDNLTINNYFTAGYHRIEKFLTDKNEKRTGHFYNP